MTEHRPDDDRLSGAMRAALAQSVGTSASDCPDASTLAAYVERTLTASERPTWDAHVSTCARCQTVVAAMVRSDERPEPRHAWAWPNLGGWRWAVPAAAAATAFGLWVIVERPARGPVAEIVEQSRPLPEVESPAPEMAPQQEADLQALKDANGPLMGNQQASGSAGRRMVDERANAPSDGGPAIDRSAPVPPAETTESLMARKRAEASADTPPPAAPAMPVAAAPTPPPTVPPRASMRERVGGTASRADAAGAAAESRQDAGEESLRAAGTNAPARLAMAVPVQIATPDPQIRWRASGALAQRSTDGGLSWIDQPLEAGVTILAGSAVSTRIAWLAGAGGAVFRTVDGTSWMRVSPPSSDDLVAVEAVSQDRATVTSQNGQRFATTDGGRTWAGF